MFQTKFSFVFCFVLFFSFFLSFVQISIFEKWNSSEWNIFRIQINVNDLRCFLLYFSGRTEEEVLKKAAERFNVAPEKIALKQGTESE